MGFLDDIAGDAEDVMAEQGETVSHTAHGGSAVAGTGIWSPGMTLPEYQSDGEQDVARGVLQVLPAAFAGLTDQSTFTIGGVVYAVALIVQPRWLTECQLVSMTKRRVGGVNNRLQR